LPLIHTILINPALHLTQYYVKTNRLANRFLTALTGFA